MMLQIGSSAAFLRGTYARAEDVPGRDHVVEEIAMLILYGLQPPPT
jgi:hypothetical protein